MINLYHIFFKCKNYWFIYFLNTLHLFLFMYTRYNWQCRARHCRKLDPKMARLECERGSSSFLSSRVQPGVLSCMADIDMCTRVFESKPSTEKRGPFLPLWASMFLHLSPSSRLLPRIRFQSGSSCTRNPENWTERSRLLLPTSVLQMNDQLESHKSAGSIVATM